MSEQTQPRVGKTDVNVRKWTKRLLRKSTTLLSASLMVFNSTAVSDVPRSDNATLMRERQPAIMKLRQSPDGLPFESQAKYVNLRIERMLAMQRFNDSIGHEMPFILPKISPAMEKYADKLDDYRIEVIWPKRMEAPEMQLQVSKWLPMIKGISKEVGVDPYLVAGIMLSESFGNPRAVDRTRSHGRSYVDVGLMQIDLQLNRKLIRAIKPRGRSIFDPYVNIKIGATILKDNLEAFGGDVKSAVMAYNIGVVGARKLLRKHPDFLSGRLDPQTDARDAIYAYDKHEKFKFSARAYLGYVLAHIGRVRYLDTLDRKEFKREEDSKPIGIILR
ncbi:MAG: lytic transglycosylase domain-containing protein [Candidatus Micrarchaeota archaeon]|nr:lytic transglycosylase domain-containing protein [Candidatus Micrarchaeota archaeon]